MNTHFSIVIDKRRSKNIRGRKQLFHILFRIYDSVLKKDKRYKLNIDLKEENYNRLFYPKGNERVSRALKETKIKLNKCENDAEKVIGELEVFTFDGFERKFFRNRNTVQNVATLRGKYSSESLTI
jgi:hypothetical protein